jgi:hypothetical protein
MIRNTIFLLIVSLYSQAQQPGSFTIKQTTDFELTADPNSASWKDADWYLLKRIKGTSSYSTKVKFQYSTTGIYCLYVCEDMKINSTFQDDFAPLFKEDVVELFIWPDQNLPLYLEYEISPLNRELAVLIPNIDGEFSGWRPWHYDGHRKTRHQVSILEDEHENVTGWVSEVFIPYYLLHPLRNVPPQKGSIWRMNLYRIDYDQKEPSWWALNPIENNFHDYQLFATFHFD